MINKNILFICGSLNQTTMMHQIAKEIPEYDSYFSPFYTDGFLKPLVNAGFLDFSILGGSFKKVTEEYLYDNELKVDFGGAIHSYDLVVTCTDLIIQNNIRDKNIVLIQEGMTDPENFMYYLVRYLRLPRYLASTSTTGLSNSYDKFCVASQGYKDFFVERGIDENKLEVTGIPNFDNAKQYLNNDFPYRNYVLVATSDTRETFKFDNRQKLIRQAMNIAKGRKIIFKLHPNENVQRSTKEIKQIVPEALVFSEGNTNHMIANCDVLITQYSSVVYIGLALDKEVYSYFDVNKLKAKIPLQNNGASSKNIARVCKQVMAEAQNQRMHYTYDDDNSVVYV
jgi:hypothetical protein